MKNSHNSTQEIRFLTTPKWILPLSIFIAVFCIAFSIYETSEKWAFGNIFGFGNAEAQERNLSNPSKFGVNSAQWIDALTEPVVRNTAALTGPGGTYVARVGGTSSEWVEATKSFFESTKKYCLTPILRLETNISASDWANFFSQVGGNDGKLVISIGNEVNFKFEYSEGWPNSGVSYANYLYDVTVAIEPHVGSAKIIGSPLNTSAPPPSNDAYIYWEDFVNQMKSVASGIENWRSHLDGHASNPYPLFGVAYDFYIDKELAAFEYSKDVYILETGPHEDVAGSTSSFMDMYWSDYCSDGGIAAVNFFNAAGNNDDKRWLSSDEGYGNFVFDGSEVTDDMVSNCNMAAKEIRYTDFSACEIVDRSEYTPMAVLGSLSLQETSGVCVTEEQTPLIPKPVTYSGTGPMTLTNGVGGAFAIMNVDSVSVAAFLQSMELENNTYVPNASAISYIEQVFSNNVNYDVDEGYPADGTYTHTVTPIIQNWMSDDYESEIDENGKAKDAGIDDRLLPYQGISYTEGNECNPEFGTFGETASNAKLNSYGYVWYPLGSALGAVAGEDPYNIYANWDKIGEFVKEEDKDDVPDDFKKDQTLSREQISDAINNIISQIVDNELLLKFKQLLSIYDNGLVSVGKTTPEGLIVQKAFTKAALNGEQGVWLGDFDYAQDCVSQASLISYYEGTIIHDLKDKRDSECYHSDINEWGIPVDKEDSSCKRKYNEVIKDAETALGDLKTQYTNCIGGTGTSVSVSIENANLSLTAPFVPIMAQYRVWDVVNSVGGTTCEAPEEELYGAEVLVNVEWYSKNSLPGAVGCTPVTNYLTNGDFEGGYHSIEDASGDFPDNWNTTWRQDYTGGENKAEFGMAPEFDVVEQSGDPRRVFTGEQSLKLFTTYGKHDVTIYSGPIDITKAEGAIELSAYGSMWRNDKDKDSVKDENKCVMSNVTSGAGTMQACIVPASSFTGTGSWETYETNGWCSGPGGVVDDWQHLTASYDGADKSVYVVLRSTATWGLLNTDDYWDNICLVEKGKLTTVPTALESYITPRQRTGSACMLYNSGSDTCAENLSESNKSAAVANGLFMFSEKLTFYMPGLGAMPYLAERLETGVDKSIDVEPGVTYCKDRTATHGYNDLYSTLDVYIIQNLNEKYAMKFAKFIAPAAYSKEEFTAIRGGKPVEDKTDDKYNTDPGEEAPMGYDREATDNEKLIMEKAKANGFTKAQAAYALATAKVETTYVVPISEIGCSCPGGCTAIPGNSRSYGDPYSETGECYYGRGFVQLTHYYNYSDMNEKLHSLGGYDGIDIYNNADQALNVNVAAEILIQFLLMHDITDFISSENPSTREFTLARAMINGNDVWTAGVTAAGHTESYLNGTVMDIYDSL